MANKREAAQQSESPTTGFKPSISVSEDDNLQTPSSQGSNDLSEASSQLEEPAEESIALRAYELWIQNGCPIGSSEADWSRAEQELRAQGKSKSASASGS